MKKLVNSILVLAFLAGLFPTGWVPIQAQSCFIRLQDASGISPSQSQIDSLESAACRLIDSFPVVYQDSFRVFDFGFYLNNEVTDGRYPEAFQLAIEDVQSQSPYYLLFGKQTDQSGVYTRFWVDLKLPDEDIFYCIDQLSPNLRSDLETRFEIIANTIHGENEKLYYKFQAAELGVIDSLIHYLSGLKECCEPEQRSLSCSPCVLNEAEFGVFLESNGFVVTECFVKGEGSQSGDNLINRVINVGGNDVDVDEEIQKYIDAFKYKHPQKGSSI